MEYKVLGKTDLKVSEFGFGCLQIPKLNEKEAIRLLREAYDLGINFFDTAQAYQNSENILGKALKNIRGNVIISSKSLETDEKVFVNKFNKSLKNLKIDYIDIFLLHDISKSKKLNKLLDNRITEILIKEKKKGKIRFIGFSCHSPKIINEFFKIDGFSVLMIPINFISTEFIKNKSFNKVLKNNIGIMGMKSLGGGRINDIELCFKYIKQYSEIVPVIGMRKVSELKENIYYISNRKNLDRNDLRKIKKIKTELGKKFCRGCSYCMPCPQGIDIPRVNFLKISYKHHAIEKFLTHERSEAAKKVDKCLECRECEKKCPYDLNIIELLKENRDFYLGLK